MATASERRQQAMMILHEKGQISVSDLSAMLNVSEVTVRKDLRYLEEQMLLARTYGGAILTNHTVYDRPFTEKTKHNAEEKYRIGKAAANLIQDNDTVILDSGTTTLQIARNLRGKKHLVIMTNSIHIILEVLGLQDVEILFLGGIVRQTSASAVGPHAEQMLQQLSFRRLFLAGDGLDVEYGLTTTNALEANLNRMMIQATEETTVVVDSSKFGCRGLSRICGIELIDRIITDEKVPEQTVHLLEEKGIEVLVV